jgi:hypothetical protein
MYMYTLTHMYVQRERERDRDRKRERKREREREREREVLLEGIPSLHIIVARGHVPCNLYSLPSTASLIHIRGDMSPGIPANTFRS